MAKYLFGVIMPNQGEKKSQSGNSALNLWQEAVEKASIDLEKIVNRSIQRLESYGKELEKSLEDQLQRASSETASTIEANTEELNSQKEQIHNDIIEFEREKTELILVTAHESRSRVDRLVRDTKREILDQFNLKLEELQELLSDPKKHFDGYDEERDDIIDEAASSSKEKTVAKENECKQSIDSRVQELDNFVDETVDESNQGIEKKLEEYTSGFDSKIEQVLAQLDDVYQETREAAASSCGEGTEKLEQNLEENIQFLKDKIASWKESVSNLKDSFENEIESKTTEHFKNHINRLEYRVSEAKAAMNHVSNDANARVSSIHKSYYSSLKRLERKYQDRIQQQLGKLELLIQAEAKLPQSNKAQADRIREELQKKLDSQIKVRGNELIKSIKKQVEQLEGDFKRQNMNSTEQIESIRVQSIESLEKQVRTIRSELDRVSKSFNNEVSHLATELPEIEERGHVAAMSVSAYQSSMLTLESD